LPQLAHSTELLGFSVSHTGQAGIC
jgi:hypothetical protein